MDQVQRAEGALMGVCVGNALGEQARNLTEAEIAAGHPNGIKEMYAIDRQRGDEGELTEEGVFTLLQAFSIAVNERFDADHIKASYRAWVKDAPSWVEKSIVAALQDAPQLKNESAFALSRLAPLTIHAWGKTQRELLKEVESECSLTHLSPLSIDCAKAFALALSKLLEDGYQDAEAMLAWLKTACLKNQLDERVRLAVDLSPRRAPKGMIDNPSSALHLCLHTLATTTSFEQGMVLVVAKGGQAGTNAALFGALAGASHGIEAIPDRWIDEVKVPASLQAYFKKQTTYRRQDMRIRRLVQDMARRLISLV